jgi:hypothetical protein
MSRIRFSWAKWTPIDKALLIAILVGYAILFYRFRSNQGDFGDFIKAGEMIWNQQNPYSELMYVNSPVSAVALYLLSIAIPILLIPTFIQILNLLGILYFFKSILKESDRSTFLWILLFLLLFNSTRALVANVQVTGLLLGLIAISFTLARNSASSYKVVFPLWLAMEIKPQLAIPFVLIFLFNGKLHKARILFLASYYFLAHLLVNIKFGSPIDLLWVEKIARYSSNAMREGYEISYWKGLSILSGQENLVKLLSQAVVLVTLSCVVYLALKAQTNWAILVAILFPIQNSYLHLYDLVPASILIIILYLGKNSISLMFGLLIFMQIYPLNLFTQVGVLLLCTPLSFMKKIEVKKLTILVLMMFFYSALILFQIKDFSEEMQIILSLTIPLFVVLLINRKKLSQIIEI